MSKLGHVFVRGGGENIGILARNLYRATRIGLQGGYDFRPGSLSRHTRHTTVGLVHERRILDSTLVEIGN